MASRKSKWPEVAPLLTFGYLAKAHSITTHPHFCPKNTHTRPPSVQTPSPLQV